MEDWVNFQLNVENTAGGLGHGKLNAIHSVAEINIFFHLDHPLRKSYHFWIRIHLPNCIHVSHMYRNEMVCILIKVLN